MIEPEFNCWGFVIDTTKYAGKFECEMCAHLTGQIGECGQGSDFINEAADYAVLGFTDTIAQLPDEHGCLKPVSIYPSKEYFNNGAGFDYKVGEEAKALEVYKAYVRHNKELWIKILEDYRASLLKGFPVGVWTEELIDAENTFALEAIQHAENTTVAELGKYPAYNSVVIFFYHKPAAEQINYMKNRAGSFSLVYNTQRRYYKGHIEILGFRVVEFKIERTKLEEEV